MVAANDYSQLHVSPINQYIDDTWITFTDGSACDDVSSLHEFYMLFGGGGFASWPSSVFAKLQTDLKDPTLSSCEELAAKPALVAHCTSKFGTLVRNACPVVCGCSNVREFGQAFTEGPAAMSGDKVKMYVKCACNAMHIIERSSQASRLTENPSDRRCR